MQLNHQESLDSMQNEINSLRGEKQNLMMASSNQNGMQNEMNKMSERLNQA